MEDRLRACRTGRAPVLPGAPNKTDKRTIHWRANRRRGALPVKTVTELSPPLLHRQRRRGARKPAFRRAQSACRASVIIPAAQRGSPVCLLACTFSGQGRKAQYIAARIRRRARLWAQVDATSLRYLYHPFSFFFHLTVCFFRSALPQIVFRSAN